jgi:arginine decarboxylase
MMMMSAPRKVFFTRGVGVHKDRLASFEAALRAAGIEMFNLVYVSSIFPPKCIEVTRHEGLRDLSPGEIIYTVLARADTNEPNRLVSAAVGLALPKEADHYGYLSEHHAYGEDEIKSGEYAEDLAATMLATTLGIEFDPDTAWQEREQIYKASGKIIETSNICQSANGDISGKWTTVIAAAVFVME